MKKLSLLFISALALTGATLGLVGCVGGEVGVGVDAGPYYNDGPWVWGHSYYHDRGGWGGHAGGFHGGWGGGHR
jgi:hypothetical protein